MAKKKLSFENEFEKLSTILKKMENDKLSLEETFNCYKKGIEHYRNCKNILETFTQNYNIVNGNSIENFVILEEDEDNNEYEEG